MRLRLGLAGLLAMVLTLSPVLAAEGGTRFSDVEGGSWYAQGVAVCVEEGLMEGVGDGRFAPEGTLSQAETLVIALRLYDLCHGGDGVLDQAPEEWGRIVFTTADGITVTGYGGKTAWRWAALSRGDSGRPGISLQTPEELAWGLDQDGKPATLILEGREWAGTAVYKDTGAETFLYFDFPFGSDGIRVSPSSQVLTKARYLRPGPEHWWRDACYYADTLGLLEWGDVFARLAWDGDEARPTSRRDFAEALALAAGALPALNQVPDLPDLDRDSEDIYALYNAGVLTGTDAYGTFNGSLGLTRAEAAVICARVLRPELRVKLDLSPLPYRDYALTAVDLQGWETYGAEEGGAAGWLPVYRDGADGPVYGILRPDGTIFFQELEGGRPYSGEGPGSVGNTPYATLCRGLDREEWARFDVERGRFTVPFTADYDAYLAAAHPAASPFRDGFALAEDEEGWYAVDAGGQTALPGRYDDLINCGDGVFVYREGERWGLVTVQGTKTDSPVLEGYMDMYAYHAKGGVLPLGRRYYNYEILPVTPAFDWAGPIGDDGAGFVGLDGVVYRIQFAGI